MVTVTKYNLFGFNIGTLFALRTNKEIKYLSGHRDSSTYLSPQYDSEKGWPAIGRSECCPKNVPGFNATTKSRELHTFSNDFPIQRYFGQNETLASKDILNGVFCGS